MRAREGVMQSDVFGDALDQLYPIIEEGGSDSAAFDNVLELLIMNGVLSLPEAVMMLVPEAWQNNPDMNPKRRHFMNGLLVLWSLGMVPLFSLLPTTDTAVLPSIETVFVHAVTILLMTTV